MENFGSIDEVLDFAIGKEEEAYQLYTDLANNSQRSDMREVFSQFAAEEQGHKAKLLTVKRGGEMLGSEKKVQDLKISDYLIEVVPHPGMTYQEALIVAMQAEKRAYMLYTRLAAISTDAAIINLFEGLAFEEAKHKLRFEVEYDEQVLKEN